MKRLLATTALIALIGAPAMAASAEDAATATGSHQSSATAPAVTGAELSANEFIGDPVYVTRISEAGETRESVGEVADLLFDESGAMKAVLVDVGGFLGVGEKRVAVDLSALSVTKGEDGDLTISTALTQEQLEAAPIYNAEVSANASLAARSDANPDVVKETLDADADHAAAESAAGSGETLAAEEEIWTDVDPTTVAAERLEGATVYDANDENIGEIDRIVGVEGQTQAVIDVGGFLGFGEKPVLVPLSQLRVTQTAEGEVIKVHVARTGAALGEAPAFNG